MKAKLCILVALALLAGQGRAWARPKMMSLQIREGQLRETASFLGRVTAQVRYGDRFTVSETQGPWSKVAAEAGGAAGWIHTSALTSKRVTLKAGETDAELAASSGELALAGKGFNSEVESEFKSRNSEADFKAVDRVEQVTVNAAEVQAFLEQGNLAPKGGAQ